MLFFYTLLITPILVLIPLTTALVRFKHLITPYKFLFLYLLISGIFNIVYAAELLKGKNNLFMFNAYSFVDFTCLSVFYMMILPRQWRLNIIALAVFFFLFAIIDIFFLQRGQQVHTYLSALQALITIGYTLVFLSKQTSAHSNANWEDNGLDWVNTGFLLYYSSTFLLFLFFNNLLRAKFIIQEELSILHDIIVIIRFGLITIGFYKSRKVDG